MGDADATQERRDVVADVDEIIEHVINANMLNMPYYVYSELFDAVDGLGAEIENLQSENAKLRELVREIWKSCPVSEDDCAECPHRLEEDDEVWCDIPILMEQLGVLGVEVDG